MSVKVKEELNVVNQSDLERERYLARVSVQRDELSRLDSAREDGRKQGHQQGLQRGELLGLIHAYQRLLKQPLTAREELLQRPLPELQQLVQELEAQLRP
jgi:flagellar biosynthesis/type III secretory pathway protein FliH